MKKISINKWNMIRELFLLNNNENMSRISLKIYNKWNWNIRMSLKLLMNRLKK